MSMISKFICGDVLETLADLPAKSVDLVFGSPPYEDARDLSVDGFPIYCGEHWVSWMVDIYRASLRVSKGLVAFVVSGRTKDYRYSCTPEMLVADLHRAGFNVRRSRIYHRIGIPGSGGPDDLRNDYESIVCVSHPGRLPWSDNVAMGHPPKYGPGGAMSSRLKNGKRTKGKIWYEVTGTSEYIHGDCATKCILYSPPAKANPGNIIDCGAVGGGHLGSKLAHINEAPFPEKLAEFMVRTFCPPDGIVIDPFAGSGTTGAVAVKTGREFCLIDIRFSQIALCRRRILEATRRLRQSP